MSFACADHIYLLYLVYCILLPEIRRTSIHKMPKYSINHVNTPVLVGSPKLGNGELGQYQIDNYLRIPGAVCRKMLTPSFKNCISLKMLSSPVMGIYMQLGEAACEFHTLRKLPLLE